MPRSILLATLLAGAALLQAGCTTTKKTYFLSGWLDDYSRLRIRHEGFGVFGWTKPGVRWLDYRKLIIEETVVHFHEAAGPLGPDAEAIEGLALHFHDQIVENLGYDYPVVTEPGPDVLILRTAITNVMTIDRARRMVEKEDFVIAPDLPATSIEIEVLDSLTGERLGAAVDVKQGSRSGPTKVWGSWPQAKKPFDEWGWELRAWLDETRGLQPPPRRVYR